MPVTHDASHRQLSASRRMDRAPPASSDRSALSCGGVRSASSHASWKRCWFSSLNRSSPMYCHASLATGTVLAPTAASYHASSVAVVMGQPFSSLKKNVDLPKMLCQDHGMTDHVIAVDGLGKRFGPVVALDGVDLSVPQGTILGL